MTDPLIFLAEKCPYDASKILATVKGDMYFAIMLANGQIGVSSTLGGKMESDPLLLKKPDLSREEHRIIQLAYSNAFLNYEQEYTWQGDIFDLVEFGKESTTVMIGYFPPLVQKFKQSDLPLTVFDLHKEYEDLAPIVELPAAVGRASQLIISSTSLINKSIGEILSYSAPGADLFLLGPSTPLSFQFKKTVGITSLFGMIFDLYDFDVLEVIGEGLGTQAFSSKGRKVKI